MPFPNIDPVIFEIGPFAVRWYGMMYLVGFTAAYFLIRYYVRLRKFPLPKEGVSDLLFYCILGLIIGARLGYVVFYHLPYYLRNPLEIFYVWEGGMSFHGGLIGVVLCTLWFCRSRNLSILLTGDILVSSAPVGIGLVRVANFINAELYGRVTDVPWGIVFPGAGPEPRHPSQLYEAFLEGPVLLAILWWLHKRQASPGVPLFSFIMLYGIFRFFVEFFRQPDAHLGFLWGGATMGQLLSLPMILIGIGGLVLVRYYGKNRQ